MQVEMQYIDTVAEKLNLSRNGEIEEKDSWQEFQELDHLEFKKEELEKALEQIK